MEVIGDDNRIKFDFITLNIEIIGGYIWDINNQCLTLNALPSVILHFPPVGFVRTFLQLLQAITDWAWLKTTLVSLHPPHLTSIKYELGVGMSLLSLWLFLYCCSDG